MDRKLIALSQPLEVRDWSKSLGCTEAELSAAMAPVGRSAAKVREDLSAKRGKSMDRKLIAVYQQHEVRDCFIGRDGGIRTRDPCTPFRTGTVPVSTPL